MAPVPSDPSPPPSGSSSRRPDLARRRGEDLLIGRLAAHGKANYQYRSDEEPSYFVKVLTSRGPRTLWGKDLERALRDAESQPKVGDLIGARRQSREAVTVTQRLRDEQGNVIAQSERAAHRSVWVVEKVTYFAERARLARRVRDDQVDAKATVKARPELRSAFLSVRAAEEFAKQKLPNPEDRERFLELIRDVLAGSIQKGTPLPDVRLKDPRGAKAPPAPRKDRDEPTR